MPKYNTRKPSTMRGIDETGPKVQQDVLITACFQVTGGYAQLFTISTGVVPDGMFPGDLTVGKSVFHEFGMQCEKREEGEVIVLNGLPGKPTLRPINPIPSNYAE